MKNIAPFIGHFLGMFSSPDGSGLFPYTHGGLKDNHFVMEGWSFDFEQIIPILKMYGIDDLKEKFILIGLVLNHKMVDELVHDMKNYDTEHDWTYGFDNDELRELAEENISYSKQTTDYLLKHGFTLYDTSTKRDRVLDQIIEDIKSNLM